MHSNNNKCIYCGFKIVQIIKISLKKSSYKCLNIKKSKIETHLKHANTTQKQFKTLHPNFTLPLKKLN